MRRGLIAGILASHMAAGATGFGLTFLVRPSSSPFYNYVFYSSTNGELNISISADGNTEIGKHYDRNAEGIKLFEMVRMWINDGVQSDCHETGYQPFQNGERKVFSAPAPWPTNFPSFKWKS